jgi:hypothetical protein
MRKRARTRVKKPVNHQCVFMSPGLINKIPMLIKKIKMLEARIEVLESKSRPPVDK